MGNAEISFELINDLSQLGKLECELGRFSDRIGFTKKCFCEINLVLEEIFTNIVSYGYTDDAEHRIEFQVSYDNGTVELKIVDDGIPFDPTDCEAPNLACRLEDRKIGGLGLHLIKKFTQDVVHQRCEGKNILFLRKKLDKNAPCPPPAGRRNKRRN